ncbi:Ada metal-binding domain-containing protein [Ideonella oryzae]|uniref:DNA-3-methyladenine glycosylase II n=1 Tax=Ideonella oryzae TaxID=2937441 RepID=A0ABT1BIX3_9BURK|nr:AlkA N-terminal domain-containing protein [Ideonella oryzae]MCO5976173.1 helix-turn-helix domain-containing protein [Ideonella oryzae]
MPASDAANPPTPPLDDGAAYLALQTHDSRFDGRLFVGVTSTGIYCRPVCRVRLPRQQNCRFFPEAAQAEAAGFRPCLRCRPELAPGLALVDSSRSLARSAAVLLERLLETSEDIALPAVAVRLGVTERHLRRIFQAEHGVSPIQWITTRRLLLAKRLLTDTALPITQVAETAGFGSLRRFNALFQERYRLTPTSLRKQQPGQETLAPEGVRLHLGWRPPYDTQAMLDFLGGRPLLGVEALHDGAWWRTLSLPGRQGPCQGWLGLRFDARREGVELTASPGLVPALPQVMRRVRHLLDLDAQPQDIHEALRGMPRARPGLRVPGCMDGFETTVRIILGQQVTVAAGCTLAARLVARLGDPCATPVPGLTHLFPTPQALRNTSVDTLGQLGIIRSRIDALQALAAAVLDGKLDLSPGASVDDTLAALRALPGIGDWTCQLVALRVLAWPDAFPASDAAVLRALGTRMPRRAQALADAWRPWRAYAVLQLWHGLASPAPSELPSGHPDHEPLAAP